jgi:uncharacterized protein
MSFLHASIILEPVIMLSPSGANSIPWGGLAAGSHQLRFGDAKVGFDAWIWRGVQPGPTLVLNGATHGDEYEGPAVLRCWTDAEPPADLRGTIVMIPVLNEAAFAADRRCHPEDDGNLARAFPGAADGSPTARLAHLFDNTVLAHATHYVDLHSGGQALEIHPWVGFIDASDATIDATQRAMAACFDAMWCWSGPFLPGRTLSSAYERKVAAIYTESHGAGGLREADLVALDNGLQNLLIEIGCLDGAVGPLKPQPFYHSTDAEETHLQVHHPAPHAGGFEPSVNLGETVKAGQQLGTVTADATGASIPVLAETAGTVVLRRHHRAAETGDALFVVVPL